MRRGNHPGLVWLTGLALALAPGAALADDDEGDNGGLEEDLEGFEDDLGGFESDLNPDVEFDESSTEEVDRWWNIDGSLVLSSSINWDEHYSVTGTNYTGLQRLRTRLNLEFDAKLPWDWTFRASPWVFYDAAYLINGRKKYTNNVIKEYEWQVNFQDTYFEGPLHDDVDLKIGRQVVRWGRSDNVRVLDVLNPLDQREPARADIEDLILAVGMVKLDWYIDHNWSVTAIGIPEIRQDYFPAYGNDFNPSPVAPGGANVPENFKNWEAAASVRGIFEGWDVSLHYAYLYTDLPSQEVIGANMMGFPILGPVYPRIQFVGGGANYTLGSWLVKAEAAWLDGLEFVFDSRKRSRMDAMVGVEYYGIAENSFALEVVDRHLFNHNATIESQPNFTRQDTVEYAVRWTADWLNARLTTTVFAVFFGYAFQDGSIVRAQAEYELTENIAVTGGILLYQAGDLPPLSTWGQNDRAIIDVKYSF